MEELSRLQHEHNRLKQNSNTISEKVKELENKCEQLSQTNTEITAERNDAIQVCNGFVCQKVFLQTVFKLYWINGVCVIKTTYSLQVIS